MKVLVSHELIRIVENDSWRFEVQEKDFGQESGLEYMEEESTLTLTMM